MRRTLFTDEHDEFRASFRRFVDQEIVPHHLDWERDGIVPRELFAKAGANGFLGTDVPEAYGGGGVEDFRFNLVIGEEVQRAGVGGAGLGITLHNDICLPYFLSLATDEQKERWLPGICSGELITAIASKYSADTIATGFTSAVEGREYRRVAKGLVVGCSHLGDIGDQNVRREIDFPMLQAEALGGHTGVLHLVVAIGLKADGVGRHVAGELRHHSCHGGTVDTTTEEAGGLGAIHLLGHGIAEQRPQLLLGVSHIGRAGGEAWRPVPGDVQLAVAELGAVTRRQALDAGEHRVRRRDDVVVEVLENGLVAELPSLARQGISPLCNAEYATVDAVAQASNRKPVHCQEDTAVGARGGNRKIALHSRCGINGRVLAQQVLPERLRRESRFTFARETRRASEYFGHVLDGCVEGRCHSVGANPAADRRQFVRRPSKGGTENVAADATRAIELGRWFRNPVSIPEQLAALPRLRRGAVESVGQMLFDESLQ